MKKKIVTVIGARPQFIKTPLLSGEIRRFAREVIVHTGQHYDDNMSEIFMKELKIPKPDYNLAVGSDSHGRQTGKMLEKIEEVLIKEKPDLVVIFGDTNSTVAAALAAAKLHIPVAHVEAGARSFNRTMPEEINRVVSDHISSLLFCATRTSQQLLKEEGVTRGVHFVGDVMADIQKKLTANGKELTAILEELSIEKQKYILVTVHRPENTDKKENLTNIVKALSEIQETVIFPIHPRTKKYLENYKLDKIIAKNSHIKLMEPVGYLDMLALETNARLILTDSGGVQKEAYLAKVPCVTMRRDTEWPETVQAGWNKLVGADKDKILKFARKFPKPQTYPNFLGKGDAYLKIGGVIKKYLAN